MNHLIFCEERVWWANTATQWAIRLLWVVELLLGVVTVAGADIDPRYRNRGGKDGCLPPCCERNPESGKVSYFCFEYRLRCHFLVLRTCYYIASDPDRASGGNCPPRTLCAEQTIEDMEARCTWFGGEGRPLHPGLSPCNSSNPQHGYCSMNYWANEQAIILGRQCESESYYLREAGCQCSMQYSITP
jgi:hypothetical protein